MSLAALNWRYVGASSFAAATVEAVLNAIWTLGTAVTYADSTTRTPGSGSAWTWSRFQNAGQTEAAYATPPTDTLTQRIILAGDDAAHTPTMASPDTWAANTLLAGINKNSGAFNAWDNAAPFTSGTWFGYWRAWPTSAGTGTVYLYESQEAVIILVTTTGGSVYAILLGAWIDPESSDTSLDAESDGKLYGVAVSGSAAAWATSWWTQTGSTAWWDHSASIGNNHTGVFTPGSSAILTGERLLRPNTAMTTSGLKTRSGRFGRADIGIRASAAAPNDQLLGRIREIFAFADSQVPSKQSNGGTTIGYVVSASTSATADAVLLLH